MRIAILCNEMKPVPAVDGGAVETLVDLLIENNEKEQKLRIDVFSKDSERALSKSKTIKNTNFYFIHYSQNLEKIVNLLNKFLGRLRLRKIFHPYIFNAVKELKKQEYDWIIIENRPLYVGFVKKNKKEAKIALHLHNDTINIDRSDSKNIVKLCDKVLSVSEYINNRVKEVCSTDKELEKAIVLENRINVNKFKTKKMNSQFLRVKYNIPSEENILIYHGRVIEEKGVLELIKAFGKAIVKNPSLHLFIIGELNDKSYEEKLRIAINRLPLNKVLMIGYVNHAELPKYLDSANIIVLPSLGDEAFGLTIVESMAMKKPVISTNVGAIPEILSDNCGVLVENDEHLVPNLAKEILSLVSNSDKQQVLSNNGREKAVLAYNSENYLSDLINKLKL
ncbi:glycosyltransferase family 4 protein [Peribacillus frigoritolerans]|uniref:glycosyltransferase family 4 protein n=1 Tax=Peribacillus frigoritolerans TaxID=450367 RepID=UPI003306684A